MEEAIENDKKKHPDCHYGTMAKKISRQVNNDYFTEVISSAIRYCPNEAPVAVYEQKETKNGPGSCIDAGGSSGGMLDIPAGFGFSFGRGAQRAPSRTQSQEHEHEHEQEQMEDMVKELTQGLFGMFGGGFGLGGGFPGGNLDEGGHGRGGGRGQGAVCPNSRSIFGDIPHRTRSDPKAESDSVPPHIRQRQDKGGGGGGGGPQGPIERI